MPIRVFVAYGYTDQEKWVGHLVIPMLEALGVHVDTGERTGGERIDDEVMRRIDAADALVGVLQKRREYADGTWEASDYVKDEIAFAIHGKKRVIQVVEQGVQPPAGPGRAYQTIPYDPAARDLLLVELTQRVRAWIDGTVSVQIGPKDLVTEVAAMSAPPICTYRIRHFLQVVKQERADLVGLGGGFYVRLVGFHPGQYVDLEIKTNERTWQCRGVAHADPVVAMTFE